MTPLLKGIAFVAVWLAVSVGVAVTAAWLKEKQRQRSN